MMKRSRPFRPIAMSATFVVALALALPTSARGQEIPSPEEFFGFQMGADRKLARWDELVEYYEMLGERSDRLEVVNMGPTTLGNPFLALYFSSPANLARLEEYRQMNAVLSDPRGAAEAEIERAIANGKVVVVQSLCLHSTEVAAGQTAAEIAYEKATRSDEEMLRILDNTIGIMIPCFNPDGQIMVTDWYDETVGTEYEGAGPPSLYHHYIGHDNNRDAFMQNTVESQYGAQIIFRDWIPQAYVDHHQMGSYTARIYLPPYAEPVRPNADPIVWREMAWYGAHMAYKQEEAGLIGAVNAAIYSGWGHFGFHWITPFHNIAGMLTESASARLATPLYVQPDQLGGSRQLPEYEEQTTFPSPWPGGWWHVRDIVVRQKSAYMATLDIAARNRETVLRNAYLKAQRQTERGAAGDVVAFVVPEDQHDRLTAIHMVNKLLLQGVEVMRSEAEFRHDGRVYGPGTFVVSMAQPKRGVIRWLLGQTFYPDNTYTRDRDGDPIRPYDMSTDNMAEFMGVRVDPTGVPVTAALTEVGALIEPVGDVQKGQFGYVLNGLENASFKAVNLLAAGGASVRRVDTSIPIAGGTLDPGDFVVPAATADALVARVASETGVSFYPLGTDLTGESRPVAPLRIAMYQRYFGGNMDEGWTRWLLEDFEFEYTSLFDPELKAGNLNQRYDVIILPADGLGRMKGTAAGGRGGDPSSYPPEYRSGFGQEGVDALDAFVQNGGTLITFAEAGDLAIEEFELPVRNVVASLPGREFWSPGSTLKVKVDSSHPAALGMPRDALATFLANNQAYAVVPGPTSHRVERIVTFIDRDLLQSGWLLGEEAIANKAAMVSVEHGEGRVLMIGFRAQHRAQTHGTFKLLFNSLMSGPTADGAVAAGGAGR